MKRLKCTTGMIFTAIDQTPAYLFFTMQQPVDTTLLALLLQAYNKEVKDFYYFPEVVLIGRQRIDSDLFYRLLEQGYLKQISYDSFGRCYRLSPKAEWELLRHLAHTHKTRQRKRKPTPALPCFDFG